MTDRLADNIRQAAAVLAQASRVCCMTGAGVSAESGVPTFRDAGGLWEGRRPEDVATPEAFAADPADVWNFYLSRRKANTACKPNPGHLALAELAGLLDSFTLITQNIDGLHHLAGSEKVLELHGDLWTNQCTREKRFANQVACPDIRATPKDGFTEIPHCPKCSSMMRPGVVWFGETLPVDTLEAAEFAVRQCEAMLVVGTSSQVFPAAALATMAAHAGATIIEVNPEATALSDHADVCLFGPSGEVLPELVRGMR